MLLACVLPCIADSDNGRIAPTQTFDAIEQADLSIDEQAHEVRRVFAKTQAMKKQESEVKIFAVVSPVAKHASHKEDTKTEATYDFYAREAGGMPATTNFLR